MHSIKIHFKRFILIVCFVSLFLHVNNTKNSLSNPLYWEEEIVCHLNCTKVYKNQDIFDNQMRVTNLILFFFHPALMSPLLTIKK